MSSSRMATAVLSTVVVSASLFSPPGFSSAIAAGWSASPSPATSDKPSAAPSSRASLAWDWPITLPRIMEGFEAPPTRYAAGHRGIDLMAAPGDPVTIPADGIVTFVGTVVDRPLVTIAVGDTLVSMEPVVTSAQAGDAVTRGRTLGEVAAGGHCSNRCIHVGIRRDGGYVSPLIYFAAVPRAVLLPVLMPVGGLAGSSS